MPSQANTAFDQARDAFKAGDYAKALQLDQQALAQTPNDRTLHEFLALVYFAQGKYDQAAEPLYAVLSVAPGWDWTTLSGMYPDVDTYTGSAPSARGQRQGEPGIGPCPLRAGLPVPVPGACRERRRAAQGGREAPAGGHALGAAHRLLPARRHAPRRPPAEPATNGAPAFEGKLAGSWMATPAKDTKIALAIKDDGKFNWDASSAGKPPTEIAGASTFADGVLTLAAQGSPERRAGRQGGLAGCRPLHVPSRRRTEL